MKKQIKQIIILILIMLLTIVIFSKSVNAETNAFERFTAMYIETSEAKPGDKIYVDLYIDKLDSNTTITANFLCVENGENFNAEIKDINESNPYFILPSSVTAGSKFEMFYIQVKDSSGTIVYATNMIEGATETYVNCLGKKYITVLENNEKMTLENIKITGNTTVTGNDNLEFSIQTSGEIKNISLGFVNETTQLSVIGYLSSTNGTAMLDLSKMSDKLVTGNYKLVDVYLIGEDNESIHYSNYSTGDDIYELNFNVNFVLQEDDAEADKEDKAEINKEGTENIVKNEEENTSADNTTSTKKIPDAGISSIIIISILITLILLIALAIKNTTMKDIK